MKTRSFGNTGLLIAIGMSTAMSAYAFFVGDPQRLEGDLGICLPSPNLWTISTLGSWILNASLTLVLGLTLYFFNKTYNFVNSPDTLLPAAFLIMSASNPWIDSLLTSSVIMLGINILCLIILFDSYRLRNAPQQLFVVGTMISIGSMFQHAFIFLIPAYIIMATILKCISFRGIVAFILGLLAPYWIALGFGLITPESFTMPMISNLFDGYVSNERLFIGLVNCGLTVLLGLILALNNALKLYAGNSRRRHFNMAINVLGLVCAICMICDFSNLTAYLDTVYMVTAVQFANLFALRNIRRSNTIIFFMGTIYIVLFGLMDFV